MTSALQVPFLKLKLTVREAGLWHLSTKSLSLCDQCIDPLRVRTGQVECRLSASLNFCIEAFSAATKDL